MGQTLFLEKRQDVHRREGTDKLLCPSGIGTAGAQGKCGGKLEARLAQNRWTWADHKKPYHQDSNKLLVSRRVINAEKIFLNIT